MPEFQLGGLLSLYGAEAFDWIRNHRTGFGWDRRTLLLICAATGVTWYAGRLRMIPGSAWTMVVIGIALGVAMRLFPEQFMFHLYLPNRHSIWAIGIFGAIAIGTAAGIVLGDIAGRLAKREWVPRTVVQGFIAAGAPVVVVIVLLPQSIKVLGSPVDTDLERVYASIESLPKDALLAAHPDLADFVPVRSRRSVLTSTEISMAWMHNYYQQMKPRVEASLRAAYATRIENMDAELEPHGVDVFLTGPPTWDQQGYFKPFDQLVESLLERGAREGFALQSPPEERILFRSGEYYVLRVGSCTETEC